MINELKLNNKKHMSIFKAFITYIIIMMIKNKVSSYTKICKNI